MRRPSTLDRSKDLPQAAAGVTNRAPAPCMPSHSPRLIFSAPHDSIAAACSPPLPPYAPYQAILGRRGLVAYLHRDVEWVGIFPLMAQPTVEFTSDASGNWGCGAWSGTAWFQFQWPQGAAHRHIAFLELVAVLLACTVWARHWHGQSVLCRCNNQAAVQVISS